MPLSMNWTKIFLLSSLALSCFNGFSQDNNEGGNQRFSMHAKIGMDVSQMSGDGLSGFHKPGANIGAIVKGKLKNNHAFSIGIEYISKGSRAPIDTLNHNTFAYRLHYVQIPLLYHFQYNQRLQFQIGPYASYLVKQGVMANKNLYTMYEYGGQPGFRSWDVGGCLGASFIFNDNNNFLIEFGQSILPIRPNPSKTNQYSFYESGNYNSTLSFCWMHQF